MRSRTVPAVVVGAVALWLAAGKPAGAQEARGGWLEPPGGWTYCYDAGPDGSICELATGEEGPPCDVRLDGTWEVLPGSDAWDGSPPGSDQGLPGGMAVVSIPGGGDGGGDASVLRIIDPGDPRDHGVEGDPSNRKIYNGRDLAQDELDVDPLVSLFEEGVTLVFRMRQLAREEIDPFDIRPDGPAGETDPGYAPFSSHKAVIGVVSRTGFAPANFGFTIENGNLILNNVESEFEPRVEIPLCDPTGFVTVWATAFLDFNTGLYEVAIYLDGSPVPAFEGSVTLSGDTDDFPDGPRDNYLYLGLGSTPQVGAFDVDYLCYRLGAVEPEPAAQTVICPAAIDCLATFDGRRSKVDISWLNLDAYDGHEILRDGEVIATLEGSATSYTDEDPPAGAHTYALRSRKGDTVCEDTCARATCEVEVTGGPIRCITDFTCEADGPFHVWTWKNNDAYTSLTMRILLARGEVVDVGGFPCLDGGMAELFATELPPDTESFSSAVFEENQLAPGGVVVIELTARKGDEECPPVTAECVRESLCPADFTCRLDEDGNIVAEWTPGQGLDELQIGIGDGDPLLIDPLDSSAVLELPPGMDEVTVTLTPVACIGECEPLMCTLDLRPPEPLFRRGDANGDGDVNIADAIALLGALFLGNPPPACLDAADADDDGELVITDAIRILGFLFLGSGDLAPPGPECGPDVGPDDFATCVYEDC